MPGVLVPLGVMFSISWNYDAVAAVVVKSVDMPPNHPVRTQVYELTLLEGCLR